MSLYVPRGTERMFSVFPDRNILSMFPDRNILSVFPEHRENVLCSGNIEKCSCRGT